MELYNSFLLLKGISLFTTIHEAPPKNVRKCFWRSQHNGDVEHASSMPPVLYFRSTRLVLPPVLYFRSTRLVLPPVLYFRSTRLVLHRVLYFRSTRLLLSRALYHQSQGLVTILKLICVYLKKKLECGMYISRHECLQK